MTVYGLYCEDARDIEERVEQMKKELDSSAAAWPKFNNPRYMYMCSKLDWDTVREYMKDYTSSVCVCHNVEIPKACLASES